MLLRNIWRYIPKNKSWRNFLRNFRDNPRRYTWRITGTISEKKPEDRSEKLLKAIYEAIPRVLLKELRKKKPFKNLWKVEARNNSWSNPWKCIWGNVITNTCCTSGRFLTKISERVPEKKTDFLKESEKQFPQKTQIDSVKLLSHKDFLKESL